MKQKRIQRRRVKGWRMPSNTRCVTRPGTFGNPFNTAAMFRTWIERLLDGSPRPVIYGKKARKMAVIAERIEELRGKNLACFCKLGDVCHADVLLMLANR